MVKTPPPDDLAYQQGGTNHTFFASTGICDECHLPGQLDSVREVIVPKIAALNDALGAAILAIFEQQIAAGNTIDLDGTPITAANVGDIAQIAISESHGRQAITVTFTDTTTVGPVGVNSVDVVNSSGAVVGELYDFADDAIPKAGWNYNLIATDKSLGVHNFNFARDVLDASIAAVEALAGS